LLERYRKTAKPAERARFAWLIHPHDLPATPELPGSPHNDPAADARREAERTFAGWLAEKRFRSLSTALSAQQSESAKALAHDLNEAARRLDAWQP
jgi:hypothetical protein